MEYEIKEYYKKESKDLTNLLFDKGFLADDLSREAIDWLEEYLAFILQSKCETAEKTALLVKKFRDKGSAKNGAEAPVERK